jgi:hypothetical protein
MKSGRRSRAALVDRVEEGASERLGGVGRCVVLLRSWWGGQRERSGTSDKKSRRHNELT